MGEPRKRRWWLLPVWVVVAGVVVTGAFLSGKKLREAREQRRAVEDTEQGGEVVVPNEAARDAIRAALHAQAGEYEEAIACARRYTALGRPDVIVYCWEAFSLEQLGRHDEAATAYRAALDLQPDWFTALNGLRRTTKTNAELIDRVARTRNAAGIYEVLKRAAELDGLPLPDISWPHHPHGPPLFYRLREIARAQRVERLYQMKQGMKAYDEVEPVDQTFNQLARCYIRDQDTNGLAELLAVHAKYFPRDPYLALWSGELHFLRGEYAQAADQYYAASRDDAVNAADSYSAGVQYVRSWLRAANAEEEKEVVRVGLEWQPVGLRAAVLAQAGDVAGVERMLAARVNGPHGLTPFYADPDFRRLIAGAKFAELRQKYPDPRLKPGL